jgi:hypothetical protein
MQSYTTLSGTGPAFVLPMTTPSWILSWKPKANKPLLRHTLPEQMPKTVTKEFH